MDLSKIPSNILSKIVMIPFSTCWWWEGTATKGGYPHFYDPVTGGMLLVSRTLWEIFNGPIPKGIHCCHICDSPGCCRPDHLFLGTPGDNIRDMISKGRGNKQKQKTCPNGHNYNHFKVINGKKVRHCTVCKNAGERKRYREKMDLLKSKPLVTLSHGPNNAPISSGCEMTP